MGAADRPHTSSPGLWSPHCEDNSTFRYEGSEEGVIREDQLSKGPSEESRSFKLATRERFEVVAFTKKAWGEPYTFFYIDIFFVQLNFKAPVLPYKRSESAFTSEDGDEPP